MLNQEKIFYSFDIIFHSGEYFSFRVSLEILEEIINKPGTAQVGAPLRVQKEQGF